MLLALNQNSSVSDVSKLYRQAIRRLIVLEYDGVLVPYDLHPGLTKPSAELRRTLQGLCADSRNVVMLISGRDMVHLDQYWNDIELVVVAENGAYYRVPSGIWQSLFATDSSWIDRIENAMNSLAFQFPGSFVERKDHSLVWHHRAVEKTLSSNDLSRIIAAISALNTSGSFVVRHSEFALELSTAGVDPGSFLARWIGGQFFDFILAAGSARIDDSVFSLVSKNATTICVGPMVHTRANFHLQHQSEVIPFLTELQAAHRSSTNHGTVESGGKLAL